MRKARVVAQGMLLVGFVEMPLRDEGLAAMKALNGRMLKGLPISVIETAKREEAEMTQR